MASTWRKPKQLLRRRRPAETVRTRLPQCRFIMRSGGRHVPCKALTPVGLHALSTRTAAHTASFAAPGNSSDHLWTARPLTLANCCW